DEADSAVSRRRIHGGLNGQAERLALWQRARAVLS
ncbi:glycoside hydrolase family 19 protein, partial [Pseudomonas aeruginosa]